MVMDVQSQSNGYCILFLSFQFNDLKLSVYVYISILGYGPSDSTKGNHFIFLDAEAKLGFQFSEQALINTINLRSTKK